MGSVLVLNSHAAHALVAIRRLGANGLSVTAGSCYRWNAGRLSKHVDRFLTYPDPEETPEEFLRAIERELNARDYEMLLPVNEDTVATVLKHRSLFEEHTTVPFPSYEKLLTGLNKRRTVQAARAADVPQPDTLFYEQSSIEAVGETLGYPVVVKPERGSSGSGVTVCESFGELEEVSGRTADRHGPVLFQEYIPNGGERGVYTLYDDTNEMIGLTVQQRLRTRPPEGGPSTYRETIGDAAAVEHADRLLSSLDWEGLAMAEFRIDARTGRPKLIDLNPRLWEGLALSTYAGVDFPYLLYQVATGSDPGPRLDYDVGVRSRCLFTDALQVLDREDSLQALREFLTPSSKPCRFDIVSRRDPLPTLGQFAYFGCLLSDRFTGTDQGNDGSRDRSNGQLGEIHE